MPLRHFDATQLESSLLLPDLIRCLGAAFANASRAPSRAHHRIGANSFLLMPAWIPNEYTGTKLVTIHGGNRERGLPTIHGLYVLFDGKTGQPLATMDGGMLTLLRTGATSALAADRLANPGAKRHLIVGAGALAPHLARAMGAVRPGMEVLVWNRSRNSADALVRQLSTLGFRASVCGLLSEAVADADIISTATQSSEALIRGKWLQPGTHLDLVGAYTPTMRETDSPAIASSRMFVDTWEGAKSEAGDLIQAVADGSIAWRDVAGDLTDLVTSRVAGRQSVEQITAFKSVGASVEDLAAATLAWETLRSRQDSPGRG